MEPGEVLGSALIGVRGEELTGEGEAGSPE